MTQAGNACGQDKWCGSEQWPQDGRMDKDAETSVTPGAPLGSAAHVPPENPCLNGLWYLRGFAY